ncbi:protein indeterminate-domain 12 [Argentina anserina]|uniref:protein indeterminate-domain 12 n=1 Tax=Argentina anserina TaxID=57926 RepID=UPI0021766046|nr:protein indeterminate-domain 12 [Potentilla anserina]
MFPSVATMSNSTSLSTEEAASVSSGSRISDHFACLHPLSVSTITSSPLDNQQPPQKIKKKRSLPGNPDPDAEVIALSPKTLLATNRFVCEICNKGFQRDQNLQLHRRGHNLPWKLKQRSSKDLIKKRAYVCPEPSCVHHHPSRALGDLTGIKKHFCRKHGEKKWKCEKCSKIYAVQSDWKAHSKTCGTREYRCDCGTLFSRKDSFITHRAFCDALAEESARISASQLAIATATQTSLFPFPDHTHFTNPPSLPFTTLSPWDPSQNPNPNTTQNPFHHHIKPEQTYHHFPLNPTLFQDTPSPQQKPLITSPFHNLHVSTQQNSSVATSGHLSATALLQKAATGCEQGRGRTRGRGRGRVAGRVRNVDNLYEEAAPRAEQVDPATVVRDDDSPTIGASTAGQQQSHSAGLDEFGTLGGFTSGDLATWQKTDRLTRDFLGLTSADGNGACNIHGNGAVNDVKDMLSYAGGAVEFQQYNHDHRLRGHQTLFKPHGFGFVETTASETWGDC